MTTPTPQSPAPGILSPTKGWRWFTLLTILILVHQSVAGASVLLAPRPENSTTHFGNSLAVIGDIDGDGIADLAVGSPFQDGDFDNQEKAYGPPQNVGKIYLVSGATLTVIRELNDPQFQLVQHLTFGGQLGTSVANLGDLNHDGVSEIAGGLPHHDTPLGDDTFINTGRAFIFDGKTGGVLFTLDDPTPEEGARLGYAVCGLGDVNGDGIADVAVSAPKKDGGDGTVDAGIVYFFSGANGSLLRTINPPATGGAGLSVRFGTSMANIGDVDRDGVADLLVGAPGRSSAFVYSAKTGGLLFTLLSPVRSSLPSFGDAVAGGLDINHDGVPDLAVGAPLEGNLQGAVYVYSGADGKPLRKLRAGNAAFTKFGSTVSFSDDLTGDKRPDIVVGSPDETVGAVPCAGEVFIFSGNNGKLFKSLTSAAPKPYSGFGSAIVTSVTDGTRTLRTIVGTPFQDADLLEPDGDLVTHLQIGQIEVQ